MYLPFCPTIFLATNHYKKHFIFLNKELRLVSFAVLHFARLFLYFIKKTFVNKKYQNK